MKKMLTIGDKVTITVAIADTEALRQQGYSDHAPIGFSEGMLFIYDRPDLYSFWMKDMLFDLDFIYILKDTVVALKENVPSPEHNKGEVIVITPPVSFDKVLEVKSGFIEKFGVKKRDKVDLLGDKGNQRD